MFKYGKQSMHTVNRQKISTAEQKLFYKKIECKMEISILKNTVSEIRMLTGGFNRVEMTEKEA